MEMEALQKLAFSEPEDLERHCCPPVSADVALIATLKAAGLFRAV